MLKYLPNNLLYQNHFNVIQYGFVEFGVEVEIYCIDWIYCVHLNVMVNMKNDLFCTKFGWLDPNSYGVPTKVILVLTLSFVTGKKCCLYPLP